MDEFQDRASKRAAEQVDADAAAHTAAFIERMKHLLPEAPKHDDANAALTDFYAYMPGHQYLYIPTRDLWPASSVDGRIQPWPLMGDKAIRPSAWLDQNRPVEQMVWDPNEPLVIRDRVMQEAGYVRHPGASVFNLFRPAQPHAVAAGANL